MITADFLLSDVVLKVMLFSLVRRFVELQSLSASIHFRDRADLEIRIAQTYWTFVIKVTQSLVWCLDITSELLLNMPSFCS